MAIQYKQKEAFLQQYLLFICYSAMDIKGKGGGEVKKTKEGRGEKTKKAGEERKRFKRTGGGEWREGEVHERGERGKGIQTARTKKRTGIKGHLHKQFPQI